MERRELRLFMNNEITILQDKAVSLLKQLIATPSFSKEEDNSSALIKKFLEENGVPVHQFLYNIWATNQYFQKEKPTILLNSHHDTVKPNKGYTMDPFLPLEKEGKLFGLGSNDAGGCLVSLITTFLYFHAKQDLKYNLVLAATAEEEISGHNGIESLLTQKEFVERTNGDTTHPFHNWSAIVGEPTQMRMAVAERGLMVLDCTCYGKAGHAARNEGENALYKAMEEIEWIKQFTFPKVSDLLGENKMTVTVIETENKAHNVVPPVCKFVIDCRINELYSFEEVIGILQSNIKSEIKPRSFRLRSTAMPLDHPLVKAGIRLGRSYYGSPTTSDKALMDFPALKMGPGNSARSHTADEYIFLDEIKEGVELYIKLLNEIV